MVIAWPVAGASIRELPNGFTWDKSLIQEWKYPLAVLAEAEKEPQTGPLHFYFTKDPAKQANGYQPRHATLRVENCL